MTRASSGLRRFTIEAIDRDGPAVHHQDAVCQLERRWPARLEPVARRRRQRRGEDRQDDGRIGRHRYTVRITSQLSPALGFVEGRSARASEVRNIRYHL